MHLWWVSLHSDFPQACWLIGLCHPLLTNSPVRSSMCSFAFSSYCWGDKWGFCHAIRKSYRLAGRKTVFPLIAPSYVLISVFSRVAPLMYAYFNYRVLPMNRDISALLCLLTWYHHHDHHHHYWSTLHLASADSPWYNINHKYDYLLHLYD